jgi:phosphate:Na+ symporter
MFFAVMGLIGGLALFLYGMQITSEGLKSTFRVVPQLLLYW